MARRRTILVAVLLAFVLVALFGLVWIRGLLGQEPAGTLLKAVQLEVTSADVLAIEDDDQWIIRAADVDALIDRVEADRGWTYVERFGAGYAFEDLSGEPVGFVCRAYSSWFQVCEI